MINNLFTVSQQDGLLNANPDGVFTSTSELPNNDRRIIKGTSDIVCVQDGLPGCNLVASPFKPTFACKENGVLFTYTDQYGQQPSINANHPAILKGNTIYGYIISEENIPAPDGDPVSRIVLNIITDPNYKTGTATYHGYGRTGLAISKSDPVLKSYRLNYTIPPTFGEATVDINFAPLYFGYDFSTSSSQRIKIPCLTLSEAHFKVTLIDLHSSYTINLQHTDNPNYFANYGPQPITILDSDVILPSLEDRLSDLEAEVAAIPGNIDKAFALAVDKVSKLFITR